MTYADGSTANSGSTADLVPPQSAATIAPVVWGRARMGAGLLSAFLGLAACTSSPSPLATLPPVSSGSPVTPATPGPSQTTESASTPVITPSTLGTVTATAIPTSAPSGDNSEAAAISTAEAYLAAYTLSAAEQSLAPVKTLALPTCSCLTSLAQAIQLQKTRKHRIKWDLFGEVKLSVKTHDQDVITIRVDYSVPAVRTLDLHGKVVSTTPAQPVVADIPMKYVDDSWKVADYLAAS